MKRKVLTIVQIVIAAVVVAYFILPDLLIGLFDDAFFVILAVGAEIALTIVQIVSKYHLFLLHKKVTFLPRQN